MPHHAHHDIAKPEVDPTVPQHGNRHGTEGHYSGQEPGSFDNPTPDDVAAGGIVGGAPAPADTRPAAADRGANIPPEAGHRATVDQHTGEVHGAGAGAGGGRPGEDFDDTIGGSND